MKTDEARAREMAAFIRQVTEDVECYCIGADEGGVLQAPCVHCQAKALLTERDAAGQVAFA